MANRIISGLNEMLRNAGSVADFYSGRYLSNLHGGPGRLTAGETYALNDIDMYYRIKGYELYEDKEQNFSALLNMSRSLIGSAGALNIPVVFSVYSKGQEVRIYYGTHHSHAGHLKDSLSGNIFSAGISNESIPRDELSSIQDYNGFIAGISRIEPGTIDRIINSLSQRAFLLNILARPVPQREIAEELSALNSLMDSYQSLSRTEITIGSNRARRFDHDNHDILELVSLLERERSRLQRGQVNGLWQVAVHVSAATRPDYDAAAATVASAFRSGSSADRENALSVVVDAAFPFVQRSVWSLPTSFLGERNLGGIYASTMLNIAELETVGSIMTLPAYPHAGYSVKHVGLSSTSTGAFSQYPAAPGGSDGIFAFGRLDNGRELSMDIDDFRLHAFVTGRTRFGKTTSVKRILKEALKNGIPFVVIEAVKKEYWKLTSDEEFRSVKVFSAGRDARDLRINPFQPETNTQLELHIQSLIQAFLTLFEGADPFPQLITHLVRMCYNKKGWTDTSIRVRKNADLEYPVLQDMLTHLEECVREVGYGEELSTDMRGAVKVRISSLIMQAGGSFNTLENTSIADFYRSSSIIELDDFADSNKPFVASLIAIKANQFSKQQKNENKLKRLLVIEEAHHIIPNPEMRSVSQNAAACSNYFSNMLAEVSAYGTGLIIVDQRPSVISSAALANTGVKIVHSITQADDIDAISRSLSLMDYEAALLSRLDIGQAVVATPLQGENIRIRVDQISQAPEVMRPACLFCDRCIPADPAAISQYERNYIAENMLDSQTIAHCINAMENKSLSTFDETSRICLAGKLAELTDDNDIVKRQHIYDYVSSLS